MARALLIIRTPLQAKLSEIALLQEGVTEYDLLYLTQRKTAKTIWYFDVLAEGARKKSLVFVPEWFFSGLAELSFYVWGRYLAKLWGGKYDVAIFSSLDSLAITGLATKFATRHITVDDGAANIDTTGIYFQQQTGLRDLLLRRLFNAPNLSQVKASVERHYTLFPSRLNAIEPKKLIPISNWPPKRISIRKLDPIVIYIGGAEHLWGSYSQIKEIQEYLATKRINFYLPHPMDKQPIVAGVPELPHSELLAEEALALVPGKFPLHLIGIASTVLFTARRIATHRTMLIPKNYKSLIPAAREAGCEIFELRQ